MYDQLVEFHLMHASTIKALVAGTMVSGVCSIVGCFIVLRRMSFMADALSHSMVAGVIAGYLIVTSIAGPDYEAKAPAMIIGAMISGFFTVGMISLVTRFSRIKEDTAIGIMYTGIFALGGFVASLPAVTSRIHFHLYDLVVGDILAVSNGQLWMMAWVTVIVVSCILLFFRSFQLISFDPIMAASIGVPVILIDYTMTACTSLVVVTGVNLAGVILVVALVITPAASAYLLFDRLKPMLFASAAFGIVGFWLGYFVASQTATAPGAAIVLTMTGLFLLTLLVAPRYGLIADLWRKASSVPQALKEDVLGYLMRQNEKATVAQIVTHTVGGSAGIRRAVWLLERQDLLEISDGIAALTATGKKEAIRLLRAHRLWETYLKKMGTPNEKIHDIAHQLEHVSDSATVDYLDDRLGHPIQDPHGSEIPPDVVLLESGQEIRASLLRKGNHARITRLLECDSDLSELEMGMEINVLPRSPDGSIWSIVLPNGKQLSLDHQQVDNIFVELISL